MAEVSLKICNTDFLSELVDLLFEVCDATTFFYPEIIGTASLNHSQVPLTHLARNPRQNLGKNFEPIMSADFAL